LPGSRPTAKPRGCSGSNGPSGFVFASGALRIDAVGPRPVLAPDRPGLSRRIGRFEQANEGTLFLDEVADLPMPLQAKLLRATQERTIERLGSNQPIQTNFRLIVATAQDVDEAVASGQFREDLFYPLNVVKMCLPALRERREDIPLFVQRFLSRSEKPVTIQQNALDRIIDHDWPGNVRELENVITRAFALAPGGVITAECIEFARRHAPLAAGWLGQIPYREGFKPVIRMVEAELLRAARPRPCSAFRDAFSTRKCASMV